MRYFLFCAVCFLSACASTNNEQYLVSAYDAKGRLLTKRVELGSNKAGVPLVRDTLCKVYPKAVIRVHEKTSKQLAKDFQPYSCR
ncbi:MULTISPECIES: hypothetical protein [Neisseria]|uniref:Lipoprotein n=1 Tax=Neisseria dumasiana TaxID=1931275 RepID=A0A1X3DKT4_9NEIS|nr:MULTISPECIES: hypothetical protein [Neisseria]KPN74819.1 hypothetical protein AKG43_00165 [Neisseria sp. 74A18]OSI24280.1 hypothetical protein BV912_02770 [Neisseria dumasiana]OSI36623.1 hypothetical protein BV913_01060 [Neisseria dumasiana]UOO85226.1 hypothetical protein LVJ88_04400 [Neisseria dumasiana]